LTQALYMQATAYIAYLMKYWPFLEMKDTTDWLINYCSMSRSRTFHLIIQGSKLAHVRKSETSKISGGLVKIQGN
jgi:hypothetical protein